MRIAIIAYYFPPHPTVGSTRPENWAEWLSEEHEVSVVSAFGEPTTHGMPERRYQVYPTGRLFVRLLEGINRWRKSRREKRATQLGSTERTGGSASRGILTYRMPCLHDLWGAFALLKVAMLKPDLVIATHSPYITLLTGLFYCHLNKKCRLWLDFRDPWSGNRKMRGLFPFSFFEMWLERKALARADVVTAASQGFASQLQSAGDHAHVQIINNTAGHRVSPTAKPVPICNSTLKIVYTGIVEPGWRDPSPLFETLARLRSSQAASHQCKLIVASPNMGDLMVLAKQYGVSDCIDVRGPLKRADALHIQETADVLLVLEHAETADTGVIPAKVFEYFLTDKPILIVGPRRNSEVFRLVESAERLLSLDELEEILKGSSRLPSMKRVDNRHETKSSLVRRAGLIASQL